MQRVDVGAGHPGGGVEGLGAEEQVLVAQVGGLDLGGGPVRTQPARDASRTSTESRMMRGRMSASVTAACSTMRAEAPQAR